MKLVKLQCPHCGAALKVKDEWGEMCHCEYCNSSFVLQRPAPSIHQTVNNYYPAAGQRTGGAHAGRGGTGANANPVAVVGIAVSLAVLLGVLGMFAFLTTTSSTVTGVIGTAQLVSFREQPESEPMQLFAAAVLAEGVEPADLRYLQVEGGSRPGSDNTFTLSYSLASYDPVTGQGAEQVRRFALQSGENIDWLDFQCFTGLEVLIIGEDAAVRFPYERDMQSLPLPDLWYYSANRTASLALLALEDPTQLTALEVRLEDREDVAALTAFTGLQRLRINRISEGVEGLQELSALTGLETLVLGSTGGDISWLPALTSLRHLTIESCSGLTDYTALSGMPSLETLELHGARELKTIGFVSNMPGLGRLVISDSQIRDITPLLGKLSLTWLELRSAQVQDYTPLETLTSLTALHLSRSGTGEEAPLPDLSGLTLLEEVTVGSNLMPMVAGCATIRSMTLRLADDYSLSALSGLSALEELTIEGGSNYVRDTRPLSALPALRALTLDEGRYYNDAQSGSVFAIPGLERLTLAGASFTWFDGSIIAQNTGLLALEMDNCNFFNVAAGKTVKLPGSLEQLILAYPSLQELRIPKVGLEDIGFTKELTALRFVDFSDNYITDVSPLAQLPQLERAVLEGNPVENLSLLQDRGVLAE